MAAFAQGSLREASAQTSRPIDEMRGNCDHYALDVQKELAAMANAPQDLTTLTERGAAPPISPNRQTLLVTQHHREAVTLHHAEQ